MSAVDMSERLARAQDFLSRDEHEAAWQELSDAGAIAETDGDEAALKRIAGMARILASRTKGDDRVRAENLYRSALGLSPVAEDSVAAVRTVDWRQRSALVRDVAVYSILGGFILSGWLVYLPQRLGGGSDQAEPANGMAPVAWSLARGAADALVALIVLGSVRYLMLKRKPGRNWNTVTFARKTMGVTLILLFVWYLTGYTELT